MRSMPRRPAEGCHTRGSVMSRLHFTHGLVALAETLKDDDKIWYKPGRCSPGPSVPEAGSAVECADPQAPFSPWCARLRPGRRSPLWRGHAAGRRQAGRQLGLDGSPSDGRCMDAARRRRRESARDASLLTFFVVSSVCPSIPPSLHLQFLPLGFYNEHSYSRPRDPSTSSFWFWKYSRDAKGGADCCSLHWISTHYTKPEGKGGMGPGASPSWLGPHCRPLNRACPFPCVNCIFLVTYALDALERSQCKSNGMQWPWLALPTKHTYD